MIYRSFDAKLEKLDDVLEFIDAELEKNDAPMKSVTQINVSVEEIFVNIVNYAYHGTDDTTCDARIGIEVSDNQAIISFEDAGVEFDPLAKPDPDITLSADERGIGGLGIFMVKKFMDDAKYERCDNKNILTIIKKW